MVMFKVSIFFILSILNGFQCQTTIELKQGKLSGVDKEYEGKKIVEFRGVPFAAPPIGDLRFKPTAPLEKFPADPYVADADKPHCTQVKMSVGKDMFDPEKELAGKEPIGGVIQYSLEMSKAKDSEDCLYANIFAPAEITPESKRPILVIVHGGVFQAGGASGTSMDAGILAAVGDAVVAVIQYRLGVLGFLHGMTEDLPGNQGLLDQQMAFKFMKENAAAFGGDPDLIVPMGFDSGGWSVGFHMLAPSSQELFKRTIMQSGSALAPIMLFGENAARYRFQKFVAAVGCPLGPDENGFTPPTPETQKCLADKPLADILAGQEKILSSKKDSGFMPTEEKLFFVENPYDSSKKGKFGQVKESLFGSNSNEGGFMLASALKDTYPPITGEPKPATLNDLVEMAKKNGAKSNAGQMQMMLPMFFRGVNKKDPEQVRKRLVQLAGEGLYVCPDMLFLNDFVKAGGSAFYYRFDHRPSNSILAAWLEGAQHLDLLQFIMGRPMRPDMKDKYTDKEIEMSKKIIQMWTNFARTGDPAIEGVKWKATSGKDKNFATITVKGIKPAKGFPKNTCKDLVRYYQMGRSFLKTYKPS